MSRKAKEPLKPIEICVGNFIESMGNIELVTGVMKVSEDNFDIGHTGWNKGISILPPDVYYSSFPIPLTEEWKVCFRIEKYKIPEWVKFVHQVQNYFMWALQVNLLEIMDWDLLPRQVELDLTDDAGN